MFTARAAATRTSAATVVAIVSELCSPASVVDFGCGVGTWLDAFVGLGCRDVVGVDGPYVPKDLLEISEDRFVEADLSSPIDLKRRFDLAICLEVAEHLPPSSAEILVSTVVRSASVVLFSAAIPGQGGEKHVNEQWPSYWASIFAEHDYRCVDCIRPRIWDNETVFYWYRQNAMLFVESDRLRNDTILTRAYEKTEGRVLSLVHPCAYKAKCNLAEAGAKRGFLRRVLTHTKQALRSTGLCV